MPAISGVKLGEQPYIIAEIGQNHNGDVYEAIRLVAMAVRCGCDAVKFQLRDAEAEFPPEVLDAPHPNPANAYGETYREHRKALDLKPGDLKHIKRRIEYNEWPITMFVTPCHISCVETLIDLKMPAFKIASKDMWNKPMIEACLATRKPVLLSTGMATGMEVFNIMRRYRGEHNLIPMLCSSEYPCPVDHVDLEVLHGYRILSASGVVGFSDHTVGILAAPLSIAYGATVIEKHITLARAAKGTDHAVSLEEDGLRRLVRDCHNAVKMRGDIRKMVYPDAQKMREVHAYGQ